MSFDFDNAGRGVRISPYEMDMRLNEWWLPKQLYNPRVQHNAASPWFNLEEPEQTWKNIGTIANTSVALLAVALAPVLLSWWAKKHFKGKNYSKSGVAGLMSTVVAIATGASGTFAVTQNSFESLMACLGFAMIFVVSSVFFIFFNFLNCSKELGSNCCAMLCCQCCSKMHDNYMLILFFVMGIAWSACVLVLNIIL